MTGERKTSIMLHGATEQGSRLGLSRFADAPIGFTLLALVLTFGCTKGSLAPSFVYEGERRAPQWGGTLPRLDAVPPGYQVLGSITASCQQERPSEQRFEVSLGALGCSPRSLTEGLEESAREVGGTALHRFSCEQTSVGTTIPYEAARFECSANVLANPSERRVSSPGRQRAKVLALAKVQFSATGKLSDPWPFATEVPVQPIADRRVGQLTVTLDERGTADDARAALLQAAAVLGAAHVITPGCFTEHPSSHWVCFAVVTTPEFDPRREPSAR